MAQMQRREGVDLSLLGSVLEAGGLFAEDYSAVAEFLLMAHWPDTGATRQTGSVLFFVDAGACKVRLQDNDAGECAFFSGATFAEALRASDSALRAGAGDWRPLKHQYRKSK